MLKNYPKYPSITNHYDAGMIAEAMAVDPNMKWYVTEKIHGTNYSFWSTGYSTMPGKRTGWISKTEKFFNHEPIFRQYYRCAEALAYRTPMAKGIVIYGELFGGGYGNVSKGSKVQREVQYCPQNDFMAFDIGVFDYKEEVTLLPFSKAKAKCDMVGIPFVPVLFEGTLKECLELSQNFITTVPGIYGLDAIENNYAEGLVIVPEEPQYTEQGRRIILKKKNARFLERAIRTPTTDKTLPTELTELVDTMRSLVTPMRLQGVMGKHGFTTKSNFSEVITAFYDDVLHEKAVDKFHDLNKENQKIVNKALNPDLAACVRNKLFGEVERVAS